MSLGIIASQVQDEAAGVALMSLDFVAGDYQLAGVLIAASEAIDHPEWISPGVGLEVLAANETTEGSGLVHFQGDALALLLTLDWTIVYEYEELAADGETDLLVMLDATESTFSQQVTLFRANSGDELCGEIRDDDGATFRFISDIADGPHGVGVHRFAVTRTNARLALSVDGGSVHFYEASSSGLVPINATIGAGEGGFLFNDLRVRSIAVYAPLEDAALPGLSA